MRYTYAALLCAASGAIAAPASCQPTANVQNGTLEGVHSKQYNQDYFLGIPFAQPPVGDLRFRTPQSVNASWTTTRAADKYSSSCIGYGVRPPPPKRPNKH